MGARSATWLFLEYSVVIPRAPSMNPTKRLPASPRKIRAGCELYISSPSSAPKRAIAINANPFWPAVRARIVIKNAAMAPTPADSPSMMSMMLKALVRPRSQRKESGRDTTEGRKAILMAMPAFMTTSTARVCPSSFVLGGRSPISSRNPRRTTRFPPRSSARVCRSRWANGEKPTRKETKTAIPPM